MLCQSISVHRHMSMPAIDQSFHLVLLYILPPDNADFHQPSGLPVLRMPIRKLLSPFRTNRTTVTGSRSHTHDHQLRTIGKVPSRGTTKNMRHDDDSYEELIV